MKFKYTFIAIIILAVVIATYNLADTGEPADLNDRGTYGKPGSSDINKDGKLPDFARKTVRVEEAYTFAVQNQEKVMYISCYCGCANMQHSDALLQHESLKDCYIRPDGSFEPHASACRACNDITLDVKELLGKGYSLKEVRKTIDERYSGRGMGTNTPQPP